MDCLASTGVEANFGLAVVIAVAVLVSGIVIVAWARGHAGRLSATLLLVVAGSVVLGLVPAAPAAAGSDGCVDPVPPYTMSGAWEGEVDFGDLDYSLRAIVTDDGTTASAVVDYPGLCTATWAQTSRLGDTVTFLETLTPGFDPALCVDNGIITLTPTGNPFGSSLAWTYVYELFPGFDQFATLYPAP